MDKIRRVQYDTRAINKTQTARQSQEMGATFVSTRFSHRPTSGGRNSNTALDPHTSLAQDFQWMKAERICAEYGAELHHLSLDNRFMTIAIPDDLTNDTDTGCYQASQLFHKLCTLGGPRMELQVWRINPVHVFTGGPADTKDAGELWEERHSGIPSAVNPMTLQWTTRLIQGDPYE